MHLSKTGGRHGRRVQVLPMKPGNFALGSRQSRAAARSLLVARKASEEDELRFQAVSIVDGSRLNLDGPAEAIRAGRMTAHAGESPLPFRPIERGRDADGLHERIMRGRARVERMRES